MALERGHDALDRRAAGRHRLAKARQLERAEVRLVDELRRAIRGRVERDDPIPQAFEDRLPPSVFGDALAPRQAEAVHADHARMVQALADQGARGRVHVVELGLSELRAEIRHEVV